MALILHNPGVQPLGQFDGKDGDLANFKGGEIVTWAAVTANSTDLAAADVNNDGYVGTTSKTRPAVTLTVSGAVHPHFLSDDGLNGYGTLLGSLVGSQVGQVVTGGTVLGPSTTSGSGKVTLYDKPGLFGVTLDACDTATDGLVPGNTAVTVGKALTYTSAGLLTPVGSAAGNANTSSLTVGYVASFENSGGLVQTPANLVSALNSPSGNVSNLLVNKFTQCVFWFAGA